MAQGIANFITPWFGGIAVTGTLARTMTNVRAGARSPLAGIVHALALLLMVVLAAPLAGHIPLAALAERAQRRGLQSVRRIVFRQRHQARTTDGSGADAPGHPDSGNAPAHQS